MKDEDSDWWSGLQTVSSFDNGISSTVTCDSSEEVQQFCPSSLLVESLIGQLCKLIETDPKHQKQLYLKICKKLHQMKLIDESYELEEFESMRSYYQKALYHLVSVAKSSKSPNKKAVIPKTNSHLCLKADAILEWSRYSTEYEEMDFIARGGFGQVFRARHKLDGEVYAVKKIYLRYNNATGFMQSLTEVKMLARLNHPHIVAYKAAWLEPIDPSQRSRHVFHNMNTCIFSSSSDKQDSSGGIVFEASDNENIISEGIDNLAIVKPKPPTDTMSTWNSTPLTNNPQEWACLYIQMQLCHATLRQWLDDRNHNFEPVKEGDCLALFKKIVQGVEYIHSQGIVHHDIKPSNIFVSGDQQQVQVGDFGLACPLLAHNPEVAVIPSLAPHAHRGQLGTKLYAAPEQLNGICSPKSDIYSLGIVLMELIQPFQTDMERSKVIGRLKTGNIPPELSDSFPILVRVMKRCVCHSPGKRLTAQELLELLEDEDNSNSARIIAEQSETIRRLHQEAMDREREIAELKRMLSESSSSPAESFSPSSQFF